MVYTPPRVWKKSHQPVDRLFVLFMPWRVSTILSVMQDFLHPPYLSGKIGDGLLYDSFANILQQTWRSCTVFQRAHVATSLDCFGIGLWQRVQKLKPKLRRLHFGRVASQYISYGLVGGLHGLHGLPIFQTPNKFFEMSKWHMSHVYWGYFPANKNGLMGMIHSGPESRYWMTMAHWWTDGCIPMCSYAWKSFLLRPHGTIGIALPDLPVSSSENCSPLTWYTMTKQTTVCPSSLNDRMRRLGMQNGYMTHDISGTPFYPIHEFIIMFPTFHSHSCLVNRPFSNCDFTGRSCICACAETCCVLFPGERSCDLGGPSSLDLNLHVEMNWNWL